jgi:hypothetical protein
VDGNIWSQVEHQGSLDHRMIGVDTSSPFPRGCRNRDVEEKAAATAGEDNQR